MSIAPPAHLVLAMTLAVAVSTPAMGQVRAGNSVRRTIHRPTSHGPTLSRPPHVIEVVIEEEPVEGAESSEGEALRPRRRVRRQLGGHCIYGLDGELVHGPGSRHCPQRQGEESPASPAPTAATHGGSCVSGSCSNGQGTYRFLDGTTYIGSFWRGRPHGHGTLVRADGSSYVGDWREGKRHGEGVAVLVTGKSLRGRWKDDRFLGGGTVPDQPAVARIRWPSLARAARRIGGGERDTAVVVGLERYAHVGRIPRAGDNAGDWYTYLVKTRNVPIDRVTLLRNEDATLEELRFAARNAAERVEKGGTLWFVFVGHGAPAKSGRDGLLVGFDAQQKARSIESRSLPRSELLDILQDSEAARINVLLDACFSGLLSSGSQLVAGLQPLVVTSLAATSDPRTTILTAARNDEYAGPLPGAARPAFSYLALGGLRGWADADVDGNVTAGELHRYVSSVIQAIVRDRRQRPTLIGRPEARLGRSTGDAGPDISALVLHAAATD